MKASSPASSETVMLSDAWRRWILDAVGPRTSWVRQLDDEHEWFLHGGDISTFLSGLDTAVDARKAAIERELDADGRLPKDAAVRRQVLDAALPSRLARDELYVTTIALRRLLVEAHRAGAIVMFDPFV